MVARPFTPSLPSLRWLVLLLVAAMLLPLAGCAAGSGLLRRGSGATNGRSPEELQADLKNFQQFFEQRIVRAANEIRSSAADSMVRDSATRWKSLALQQIREHVYEAKPIDGLLETWSYSIRLRQYFESPTAAFYFGAQVPIGLEAARDIEQRVADLAAIYIPEQDFDNVLQYVTHFAETHPMTGFLDDSAANAEPPSYLRLSTIGNLVSLPLSPLLVFRKANQTADSIREFNRIASRMADIVEDLPRDLRWQAQILVAEVERGDRVTSAVLALERASLGAERVAQVADTIPETAAATARAVLDEYQQAEPRLAELLAEARATTTELRLGVEAARGSIAEATALAPLLQQNAVAWEATARAVGEAVQGINALVAPQPRDPSRPPARPFDIEDYRRTAEQLRSAVEETRLLLAEVQALRTPPAVEETAARTSAELERTVRRVIDHAFQAALRLALIVAGVGAGLLLLAALLRRRREAP